MEDSRIIALYRERSEEAVSETEKKYGKMCRSIARNILRNEAMRKNAPPMSILPYGTVFRRRSRTIFVRT